MKRITFPIILPLSELKSNGSPSSDDTQIDSAEDKASQSNLWQLQERITLALAFYETMKRVVEDWVLRGRTCSDACKLSKSNFFHSRCEQLLAEIAQVEKDASRLAMRDSRLPQLSLAREQLDLALSMTPEQIYEGEIQVRDGQTRDVEDVRSELRARSHR